MHKTAEMTEQEAMAFALDLQKLCAQRGLWLQRLDDRQPNLKFITLTVSVKVKQ